MITFQQLIQTLINYWADYGCSISLPYTTEVGAATLHPATIFNCIGAHKVKIAYAQPVIRPSDGKYGINPNRLYQHHQFQVILKPSPDNLQSLYLKSLEKIGINLQENDIRFVEDDWQNPSVGAWGLGYEVWCNGMEISQFTYMQQVGGIECDIIPGELAYGLERICMLIQDVDSVYDIVMNPSGETYRQMFQKNEYEFSKTSLELFNSKILFDDFAKAEENFNTFIENGLPIASYDQALKCSHTINLLESRGFITGTERATFIFKVRTMVKACCQLYLEQNTGV